MVFKWSIWESLLRTTDDLSVLGKGRDVCTLVGLTDAFGPHPVSDENTIKLRKSSRNAASGWKGRGLEGNDLPRVAFHSCLGL